MHIICYIQAIALQGYTERLSRDTAHNKLATAELEAPELVSIAVSNHNSLVEMSPVLMSANFSCWQSAGLVATVYCWYKEPPSKDVFCSIVRHIPCLSMLCRL